ncbi:hypothetical protein [Lactiplantibacillus plantarum]|uniref:hypothetical protein n=1 Tax=Lactiplantibacillus plantarum TaxID=1590 RepID=UPI0040458C17
MSNQYEKLVEQQARLKQKIEREDFKLRQSKYYENRQARKARSRRLIQKGAKDLTTAFNRSTTTEILEALTKQETQSKTGK